MDEVLPFHPNGLSFLASFEGGQNISETYYSVGGGFVVKEGGNASASQTVPDLPFPINTSADLLFWCMKTGLPISGIVLENESAWRPESETRQGLGSYLECNETLHVQRLPYQW